jgi:hypothetical protein
VASLAIKAPCKSVSDGDGNLLLEGEQTVGGIALVAGDRVLVIEQTDPVENGIWCVDTSAWQRTADFDGNRDVAKGTLVTVNRPPNNLTAYVQTNLGVAQDEPAIGTDPLAFSIFFSQTNSIDDLGDVDTTGCSDDDLMYWSGGVLVCTLGELTWNGLTLYANGNIRNDHAQLRDMAAAALVPNVNPRVGDPWTGIGGAAGNLDMLHDNNGSSSFLGLRLKKFADLIAQRIWNVEGIAASTTQTQGQAIVNASLVRVTAVANPNDVITLTVPELGLDQMIMNLGANTLQIFPQAGDDLGLGTDAPTTLAAGGAIWFTGIDADTWHTMNVNIGPGGGPIAPIRGTKAVKTGFIAWPRNDLPDFLIPSGTGNSEQILDFNISVYDTEADAIHDTLVNNTRWHMPPGFSQFEMIIGYKLDSLGDAQAGLGHVRLRRNGITNGAVDTVQVGSWEPWNSDNNGGGTNQSGAATGEAGMQSWYSGLINMDPGDYVEVLILTQAGERDTPANGFWAEFRLLG